MRRPRSQDKCSVLDLLSHGIEFFVEESPEHLLWIVEDTRIRIRPVQN